MMRRRVFLGAWLAVGAFSSVAAGAEGRGGEAAAATEEAEQTCLNGCTGHGTCFDYLCTCDLGWAGDDCRHNIAGFSEALVPILTAGHFNVTAKNLSRVSAKVPLLFVGYSSRKCIKCISAETLAAVRATLMVPDWGTTLPLVVVYRRGFAPRPFEGPHSAEALVDYALKLKLPAVDDCATVDAAGRFFGLDASDARLRRAHAELASEAAGTPTGAGGDEEALSYSEADDDEEERRRSSSLRGRKTLVLGIFSDAEGVEEEEWDEFAEVAAVMQARSDVAFGAVRGHEAVARALVDAEWCDRTPCVVLQRASAGPLAMDPPPPWASAPVDGIEGGLRLWAERESLEAVGELTHANFALYEALLLPMALLFLDLRAHDRSPSNASRATFVGGKSSGLFNEDLVEELRALRRDGSFAHRVAFAYVDGHAYADRMKALGLFGGTSRLPALAINTNEANVVAPYPENMPFHRDAIRDYLAAFLSKKLRTRDDSKRFAVQHVKNHYDATFLPRRPKRKAPPKETVGVSEQFGSGSIGVQARGFVDHVTVLSTTNFSRVALDDTKDVLVLFHATECANCAGMAVYYKKLAERFDDLNITSLVVARFDVTDELPPLEGNPLNAAELPMLLMLPATAKEPPFTFYSGISKVQPMMHWVQGAAALKFDLPELPHLTPEDRIRYKEQVGEGERHRKRREAESEAEFQRELKEDQLREKDELLSSSSSSSSSRGDL